ncbi:phosphatidylserine lipase ABHD16A-like [Physella acuta]|uniref:phosphatidylserine lipase ABHD16A-like n=1 Tax=Physella acuta TaxID=109671 RepID=UPI0027DB1007|nr:phosphatidylserine lipase ABHD16A-like [Physella acuta]
MASKMLWTFHGPRLIRIFKKENIEGHDYVPGYLESWPDRVIQTFNTAFGLTYLTTPIFGFILYKRGHFNPEGALGILRVALSVAIVYTAAYILRGIGRLSNIDYRNFISVLVEARQNSSVQVKKQLANYDFEFWAWPVDFRWDEGSIKEKIPPPARAPSSRRAQAIERSSLPCRILSYLAMHTFGRRMVYPGGTSLMNYLLSNMLKIGRTQLVEEKGGIRAKVLTEDGNEIDTMFMNRKGSSENGSTLVITSEGNAGFYEMGCSNTPLDLNYSVLGWNHPGFGGSTGIAFPDQEQKAVDAVMQYAIHKLKFEPKDIALFAWSIGGYTASWVAKTYPDIKFVVLDATFDDIVPLAIAKMPQSWKNLVALSLRTYMDLNVADNLLEYQGPILLVRRTRDEIITTESPPDSFPVLQSNRGNFLLLKLLQHRYPTIVDDTTLPVMREFLGKETISQIQMLEEKAVVYQECSKHFSAHVQDKGIHFPMNINVVDHSLKVKLALFLITAHMENFESTHCTPLPVNFFHKPWMPGARL